MKKKTGIIIGVICAIIATVAVAISIFVFVLSDIIELTGILTADFPEEKIRVDETIWEKQTNNPD